MLRFVRSWSAISRSLPQFAPAQRPQSRRLLTLERLEDRTMLSTIALTVTTLADDPITPVAGQFTLRDAINTADGGATTNQYVITFKQGLTGTIDLTTSALPDLANNITIQGPGASNLTVQRDASATTPFSVFTVDSGVTVRISGMTISGGYAVDGGGIDNSGTLTVRNTTFTDNTAVVGGGILNEPGTLTVIGSTFIDNSANYAGFGDGGGIENYGTATVIGSTFTKNFGGYAGGGIVSYGVLTVRNTTFTDNSAIDGGGIVNEYGPLTVSDSVFIDNSAISLGGGIFNEAMATVSRSIFAGNIATDGGGIYSDDTLAVTNSTFTSNSAYDGGGIYNQSVKGDGDRQPLYRQLRHRRWRYLQRRYADLHRESLLRQHRR